MKELMVLIKQPNILPLHMQQCRYQIQQVLMLNHLRYQLKVCVLLHFHRIYQGKILLAKAFYKHFQVISILFFSMFFALYFTMSLLDHNLILKIVLLLPWTNTISLYLVRSNITTPRPLSFLMILLFFDNRSIAFFILIRCF